jgi:glycosyltransferase involved in cell wall biosynthesis
VTTLRVVLDQLIATVPGGIGRYTEELVREMTRTAPANGSVEGIISKSSDAQHDDIRSRLPRLAELHALPLARRELAAAWRYGVMTSIGSGHLHSPSLLAPLGRHGRNRRPTPTAVTIHDVVPWTHPQTLTKHGVAWHTAMASRAQKYADAVVVPTHAVAGELAGIMDFGDRIRVIGGAASSNLIVPADTDARARDLSLPDEYLLAVGTLEPRKGLTQLIAGLALPSSPDLPLLIVGPPGWGDLDVAAVAAEHGLPADRIRVLGFLPDEDLALLYARATVFVFPSLAEGFGLPLLEALSFGTPVVHSDAPALTEVAGGAGVSVPRDDAAGYPARLSEALARVVTDSILRARLAELGMERSQTFTWRDSAERVWQLHSDL